MNDYALVEPENSVSISRNNKFLKGIKLLVAPEHGGMFEAKRFGLVRHVRAPCVDASYGVSACECGRTRSWNVLARFAGLELGKGRVITVRP